jgi:aminoglycoside phosphotransferase (APT) family kinase protein
MIRGAPEAARWIRPAPRRTLPPTLLKRIVHTAFPDSQVLEMQPLTDGLRNANFKIRLDSAPEPVVLRIYEHDATLCRKEVDVIRLIGESVPVPRLIHAETQGWEDVPPFTLSQYVEGITFRELKRSGDADAIAQAAYSVGRTLAHIGRTTFLKPGWLAPGPSVAGALLEGADPVPRFVDLCLASANLRLRMPADLCDRVHTVVRNRAPQIARFDGEARLVHGDFGQRNVLVRSSARGWSVAAVLDWEFAVSGCPLADAGHFLRYGRAAHPVLEPHFSRGYVEAGGELPPNWRSIARLLDLTGLCESLTHDDLPDDVVLELVELVRAAAEDGDPN